LEERIKDGSAVKQFQNKPRIKFGGNYESNLRRRSVQSKQGLRKIESLSKMLDLREKIK
jgi:hypothetical protein